MELPQAGPTAQSVARDKFEKRQTSRRKRDLAEFESNKLRREHLRDAKALLNIAPTGRGKSAKRQKLLPTNTKRARGVGGRGAS